MGEARSKQRRRQEFFKQHPFCCYCGGNVIATTVDHVPSRQTFALKRRPKGLEVPACHACNQYTAKHEQVAALIARMYPDPPKKAEQEEVRKLVKAISKNNPGLLEEMQPSWRQQYDFQQTAINLPRVGGVLNASGPLLKESMHVFAVKSCLALHYVQTGKIVPQSGGVAARWYSNFDRLTNSIPDDLLGLFGNHATLKQGSWDVEDQFGYSWAIAKDAEMAAYFAGFRQSFAIVGFVHHDRSAFPTLPSLNVTLPGFVSAQNK